MAVLNKETMAATEAFNEIAGVYDASFTDSVIGLAQRKSVWKEIDRIFTPGQHVLEINCGTGVDALHLAKRGVHVTACDSAQRMVTVARQRAQLASVLATVDFRVLANERVGTLWNEGPFDGVLSNFAGLNCNSDLSSLAYDLAHLVKERSKMLLCLFGRLCLWETFWFLSRGDVPKALRRFRCGGRSAVLSARAETTVWYHPLRHLRKVFSPYFRLVDWKGVGVLVPPSYLEFVAKKYPNLFCFASEIDPWLGGCPGLRATADHMLLTFERTLR